LTFTNSVGLIKVINYFAKTPEFRFWQESGGRLAEVFIVFIKIKPKCTLEL